MEQFEAYFRRADLDQDGRISGAEAVSFLQGSNLSKQVLAQIWMHADKSHTGYLSREEFYNALKLVTVAQSKRELTPDIVKAALYGPASSKIPAPQMNLSSIPAPQLNSAGSAPAPQLNSATTGSASQLGTVAPAVSQSLGFRGQAPPSASVGQQYFPSQSGQQMRPPISLPASAGTGIGARPPPGGIPPNFPRGGSMVGPGLQNSNMSSEWHSGRTSGTSVSPIMQAPTRGTSFPTPLSVSNPQDSLLTTSVIPGKDSNALIGPGSRPALNSAFRNDVLSATQLTPKQTSATPSYSASSIPPSSTIASVSTGPQSTAKPDPFEVLQSTFTRQSPGVHPQQTKSQPKPNQQVSAQVTTPVPPSVALAPAPEQSENPWPKMTRAGIQKYAKVFMGVDTDRDGRITGEQARGLFLHWRLPIEVLKQVWDLSDQDHDSMLSLREFCIALYLMEQFREGRTLPSSLPSSVMLDATLLSMAGPPPGYAVQWGPDAGVRSQQVAPPGVRPSSQSVHLQADRSMQFNQNIAREPSVESSPGNQISNGDQNSMDVTGQESVETENKVESNDKVYMDSKEKLEYYRSKMQDLVLYKSRCDNRLNEITERAIADKREAEMLGKKYEEKYKQVAEIASKLTIEEASFREVQERKTELQQAITKMEQGGSADGILQVRADRIQSDLEELLKALAERCKKHGVDLKSTALVELPPGWQPGIPEVAAIWDEDWDKFEDEGFSFDVVISANAKSNSPQKEISSPTHSYSSDSMSNADGKSEKTFNKGDGVFEAESAYIQSEDESKSPQTTPRRQETVESPSQEYSDNHFRDSFEADNETNRSFDEPSWGTFDHNDDIDSVWGFNVKDPDGEKHGEKYFFDSNDSGVSPTRTDSPRNDVFPKSTGFTFEDSLPESPLSRAGNSPTEYSVGSGDHFFDNFSQYDSFSANDRASSPRRETLTRFDSINSTKSFDHTRGFSFDDSDPFGSSGPFKVSSESQSSKKGSDNWNSF